MALQQTLHGYSDGHRLLGSSFDLSSRDARTMLMMSDASGPAATIGEAGYLTGYPLAESGYYAFARTWPAPEMPRPGCVWTHSILVDFSDIPALESAMRLLSLFRRPRHDGSAYSAKLPYPRGGEQPTLPDEDASRRILFALYANPSKPVISSSLDSRERDAFVLAIWDQQWPRLKRAFRFCTLSFADRSSAAGEFDLQFLPSTGRVPRAHFRTAVDADRQDFTPVDWLDDALSDLREGPGGNLRQFLRAAGSDLSGRGSFAPLATLHALSTHFATEPDSIERAISLLDQMIPEAQGQAARKLLTTAAAAAADSLGPTGLNFVLRNFDLIVPNEAAVAAERVGQALWHIDPAAVIRLLENESRLQAVARRAIASLPTPTLLKGISLAPQNLPAIVKARPDLANEPGYWSLPDAWNPEALRHIAERPEIVPDVVDAMLRSERPSIYLARSIFGSETILRGLVTLMERTADLAPDTAREWLFETCSESGALARVLGEGRIKHAATLDAIARAATPDQVPNDVGEDPWFVATRHIAWSEATPYLAAFLLTRAYGPRTRSSAELIQLTFDTVYAGVERSSLPEDAWRLLDRRLYWSYFWPNWDRCLRIRQTTVAAFIERDLDRSAFTRITERDDVFSLLVELAADSYSGRRYLKSVKKRLANDDSQRKRLRTLTRALG